MIAIDKDRIARCHTDHQYVATEVRGSEYVVASYDQTTQCVLESYYGLNSSDFKITFHRIER